jgi:hypothetical protein
MPHFSLEDHNDISNVSDRVVIVAARFALDEYLKYAAYICQPNRSCEDATDLEVARPITQSILESERTFSNYSQDFF